MTNYKKEDKDKERNWGGLMLPSLEVLERHLALTGSEQARKAILLRSARGKKIKMWERDLRRLRKIGDGSWRTGFYRAIALAHEVWLTGDEIRKLKNKSPDGTVRGAILDYLQED